MPPKPPARTGLRRKRCPWCLGSAEYVRYHDVEWGVPVHDDRVLFEFLILEAAQAGLSWSTILAKRENYRRAFDGFDAARVARYGARDVARLMADAGIVRNRLKISAAIDNARATLAIAERYGSLDAYLWRFVDGRPLQNRRRSLAAGSRPARACRMPCRRTSRVTASGSSARRSATLSCRRWAW